MSNLLSRRRFLTVMGGAASGLVAGGVLPTLLTRSSTRPWDALLPWSTIDAWAADAKTRFPIGAATATRVLQAASARGAGFADLYLETRVVTRVNLADGAIQSVEQGVFAGCGVRAVDGERTGYAYVDSFEEEPLLTAAADAAAIASGAGPRRVAAVIAAPIFASPIVRFTRSLDDVADDERVAWMMAADQAARAHDPAIAQVTIDYSDEMQHFAVIDSHGGWIEDTLPLVLMRVDVVAQRGDLRGTGATRLSFRQGAEQMAGDAPAAFGREAARQAVAMLEAEASPAGEMPVVLAAGGGVLFHEAVVHGLEGDAILRKTSTYADRIGETVGSEKVSILDTGAMPDLRGSYNVDDEGIVPRRNLLIEKGVLRGYLTDRITAEGLKLPRTGNARRQSYRFPPMVRMSNTFLDNGADDPDAILRETPNGIFARNLGDGQVDPATGNFTFGLREAYRIENGKLGRPVRGANLVGNGPEILKRVDRVAGDLKFWNGTCGRGQWVPVTAGAPTLRISSMTVGGSGS